MIDNEIKEIRKMANVMCEHKGGDCEDCIKMSKELGMRDDCDCITTAEIAYKKGYRPQSEVRTETAKEFAKKLILMCDNAVKQSKALSTSGLTEHMEGYGTAATHFKNIVLEIAASFGAEDNDGQMQESIENAFFAEKHRADVAEEALKQSLICCNNSCAWGKGKANVDVMKSMSVFKQQAEERLKEKK